MTKAPLLDEASARAGDIPAALPGDAPASVAMPAAQPSGTVHDLGYKRYDGERLPQHRRWRVIMRQQIGFAWKTWWRWKLAMISAVVATIVSGAVMYLARDTAMRILSRGGGGGGGGGGGDFNPLSDAALRFIDGILPLSVMWYCKIGFIASMTVAASVVATDARTGAFSFYFARSVRPVDYVLGKVAGLATLAAILTFAGPLLLGLFRVGLSDSGSEALAQLRVVGYAAIVGVCATALYSIVPLGFSALVADRRWSIGLWALYYMAFGSMMTGLGLKVWGPLAALDLPNALGRISYELFGLTLMNDRGALDFSVMWDAASIALHTVVALALVSWRVAKAARDGVGGMS